jgi:superfamily II DNA or RNA helicase
VAGREKSQGSGWDVKEALNLLQARIDPYIWEQGQELYRRGAVEDFQLTAAGDIQVAVLDPRDLRKVFVTVEKDRDGKVRARCGCAYRLNGFCRHQVVSLEYLKSISEAGTSTSGAAPSAPGEGPAPAAGGSGSAGSAPPAPSGPVLYRLRGGPTRISTCPDGSLLRVVLHSLGSLETPHRIGLQLFTGTGWTELRAPDVARWTQRGEAGAHPRDAFLASLLTGEGSVKREIDSDLLATLLSVLAGSGALVTRSGEPLAASRWPFTLAARLARGEREGIGVELSCRSPEGSARPFAEVSLIPSIAPWIQLETGAFHPLLAGAPGPVLLELQEEDLSSISGSDLDRLLSEGVGELERLCPGGVEVEPGLIEEVEGVDGARLRLEGTPRKLQGRLELSYGGEWMEAPATPEPWTVTREGKIHRYPPAGQSLARAQRELETLGFRREEDRWSLAAPGALAAVLRPRPRPFVKILLPPALEALNLVEREPVLRLEVGGGLPEEAALADGKGPAGAESAAPAAGSEAGPVASRGSGIRWLEVSYHLLTGDKELVIDLEALKEARREKPDGVIQLEDGTVLALSSRPVVSLLDLASLAGAGGETGSRLRMPLTAIGELLDESAGRQVEFRGAAERLAAGLRGGPLPQGLALKPAVDGILRPYQKEAVRWLGDLSGFGLSGLLADEMGLGKTVMALAHLFGREPTAAQTAPAPGGERLPVLVVCPSSLIFNWLDECRRFFPEVQAVGLQGLPRAEREEAIRKGADLLVTSYALLRRDREALETRELRAVVLDEGQQVKNAESQTAQAAFALQAAERWVLTGTPVENHLGELWSLFHFLLPGFLGTRAEFSRSFAEPLARKDEEAGRRLRARVRPFLLRRTKAQVLSELPPRIDQIERVPLTSFQAALYQSYLQKARGELESSDPEKSRFQLLAALTRLRQVCCHPRLVLEGEPRRPAGEVGEPESGKLELCMELLEECLEESHRVLLYSQFTSMLDLIEERLEEQGVQRCRLDGSTRDREGQVRRFTRDPSIPVFLISLKAGGFGLNLTQADTVILYDPWWNPAVEEQAAARAHRMGQTLPVHVHKLISAGTVEEKILDLQATKRDLVDRVIRAEEEPLSGLSAGELRELLFAD